MGGWDPLPAPLYFLGLIYILLLVHDGQFRFPASSY